MYTTTYFHIKSTKREQIGFGLVKEVTVTGIIGIPTLKQCKYSISFESNFLTSPRGFIEFFTILQFYLIDCRDLTPINQDYVHFIDSRVKRLHWDLLHAHG